MAETRKIAAILAADVVGFSKLTGGANVLGGKARRRCARRSAPTVTRRAYIVEVRIPMTLSTSRKFIMLAADSKLPFRVHFAPKGS